MIDCSQSTSTSLFNTGSILSIQLVVFYSILMRKSSSSPHDSTPEWHPDRFSHFAVYSTSGGDHRCAQQHTDRDRRTWERMNERLSALCPGLPRWAGTRKVKPIWILLKQETAPHHSSFLQAECPSCRPTNSIKALKAKTAEHGTPVEIGRIYRMHATWPNVKVFYHISQRHIVCIYLLQNSVQPDTKSTSSH